MSLINEAYSLLTNDATHNYQFPQEFETTSDGTSTIVNIGNTCFMNSALQAIFHTQPLRDFFLKGNYRLISNVENGDGLKYDFGRKFNQLLEGVWEEECIIKPVSFYNTLTRCVHQFKGYQQHDSHECLVFILDLLHQSISTSGGVIISQGLNEISRKPYEAWDSFLKHGGESIVTQLFYGLQQTLVKCSECDNVFPKYDPYSYLSLSFPNELISNRKILITDLLDYYVQIESMKGDNQYYCDSCKKKTDARKNQMLWSLPEVLIIQLKRFELNKKIDTVVDFPLQLDMQNYVVPEVKSQNTKYELYATVNHYGALGGGHYIATCKSINPQNNSSRWVRFDDADFTEIDENSLINPTAYILFYQKVH